MGRALLDAAVLDGGFSVSAALTRPGHPHCDSTMRVGDADIAVVDKLGTSCEVMIDFSTASSTMDWLDVCTRFEIPMIVGTTGHSNNQTERIRECSKLIPIVKAANFSVGIQLVLDMVATIAKTMDESYDIELVETHHKEKIDAPSGTALAIVQKLVDARGHSMEDKVCFVSPGETGQRAAGQIGVRSVRTGDVVGQHEIHFNGSDETLTIRHAVQSRRAFALGALRCAKWILDRDPGLYDMHDVLQT